MAGKSYKQGLSDALNIINKHYFSVDPDTQEKIEGKVPMRKKMRKADKLDTAESCLWNFVKEIKGEISEKGKVEDTFMIHKVEIKETVLQTVD
jgi:hypothetical protein